MKIALHKIYQIKDVKAHSRVTQQCSVEHNYYVAPNIRQPTWFNIMLAGLRLQAGSVEEPGWYWLDPDSDPSFFQNLIRILPTIRIWPKYLGPDSIKVPGFVQNIWIRIREKTPRSRSDQYTGIRIRPKYTDSSKVFESVSEQNIQMQIRSKYADWDLSKIPGSSKLAESGSEKNIQIRSKYAD